MPAERELAETCEIKYLGLNRSDYNLIYSYASGESPEDRLDQLVVSPEQVTERKLMRSNVRLLDDRLDRLGESESPSHPSFDQQLITIVCQIARDAAMALPDGARRLATLRFIDNLNLPGQLLNHLKETGDSSVAFFTSISLGRSEGDLPLTHRQTLLMEFVARTHDICKLLGSVQAQIDPDHEVIYQKIIGKHLLGRSFQPSGGEALIFTKADVSFITAVAGSHEDIWREKDFASEAALLRRTSDASDPNVSEARARSILHFIDIFGSAVRIDGGVLQIVDGDAFERRFVDLFRRHLKLPIKPLPDQSTFDWSRGKVFRPQWGRHGVAGLTWTFGLLNTQWGIDIDPGLIPTVQQAISRVLTEAESVITGIQGGEPRYALTTGVNPVSVESELASSLQSIRDTLTLIGKEQANPNKLTSLTSY